MTKQTKYKAFVAATVIGLGATLGFSSCNDSSEIGKSIVSDSIQIVVDSNFTISGLSYRDDVILSRTITQMIGSVDIPEYGSISSEVVTQFMPALTIDTTGVTEESIDSLRLFMQFYNDQYVGDPLAPIGVSIYPLLSTNRLKSPMYSDFEPKPGTDYDPDNLLGSIIYNASAVGLPDSLKDLSYRTLHVNLPREIGQRLFREYKNNPASFSSPTAFAKIFPGLYFKNSYGDGRITRMAQTSMRLYFHSNIVNDQGRDTVINKVGDYFAVTPEIISNNNISLTIAKDIEDKVAAGETVLLAPAGYDVEFKFPAEIIKQRYDAANTDIKVINTLELYLPAEQIPNKYDITPPTDVLLVLKKDKDNFFLENKMPDNITSFRATYSTDYSAYTFSGMRQYIVDLLKKDKITDEDVTFCLIPISVVTETNNNYYGTSSVVTAITPYVTEPKMAKILFDKAKITFVYSKQTIIF